MITTASWEPRFLLGFIRLVEDYSFEFVLMYYFSDYSNVSLENRNKVKSICNKKNIPIKEIELNQDLNSWISIFNSLGDSKLKDKEILVDISTMPRETIWIVFHILQNFTSRIQYIYNKPEGYSNEWLSRDPGKPRLVYKLSGIAELGKPTTLVVITGFDIDRVNQLIYFFEPETTLLGIQIGSQFSNLKLNSEKHIKEFTNTPGIKIFDVDAYSDDRGLNTIRKHLLDYVDNSNLIMSSLGPKLTAVSLFKIAQEFDNVALSYAPSNEFNIEYSRGIGDTLTGTI
ncbi:MAG: hypothetical protein AB7S50_15075 [Bacteroidales bacterium]